MNSTNHMTMPTFYKIGFKFQLLVALKEEHQEPIEENASAQEQLDRFMGQVVQYYNMIINRGLLSESGEPNGFTSYPLMARQDTDSEIVEEHDNEWEVGPGNAIDWSSFASHATWPLAFSSPIFDYHTMYTQNVFRGSRRIFPWVSSIRKFFNVLDEFAQFWSDERSGMTIAVSANNEFGWDNLRQLKNLAKSILYFEPAIRFYLPESRRDAEQWNGMPTRFGDDWDRVNPRFRSVTGLHSGVESRIALVDACHNLESLVQLMNNGRSDWSWNFRKLEAYASSEAIDGFVEFRSPPCPGNWKKCTAWIYFTVELVNAAITRNFSMRRLGQFAVDGGGLVKFFDYGPPVLSDDLKVQYRRELALPDA